MRLAWTLALRDLRGGLAGLRLLAACLLLGVGAIAGVGSLARAITDGLSAEGRAILGGDVEVRFTHRQATRAERDVMASQARALSVSSRLRAMARADGHDALLVELKSVDAHYPLYGAVELDRPDALAGLLARRDGHWGAVIDSVLADRLDLAVGDSIAAGDVTFTVRALVRKEPDRANEGFDLGPRLMIAEAALPETGLVQPGSLVRTHYRLTLAPDVAPATVTDALNARFPDAGWQIRDRDNGAPGLRRFVIQMGQFLTLVGLTALLVAGVGVGNAVTAWLDRRTATIATFKTLGASSDLIFKMTLIEVALVALAAISAGLALGAALTPLAAWALREQIPVTPELRLHLVPMASAALFGLLTALAFALAPLARARALPAARLFRSAAETPLTGGLWRARLAAGFCLVLAGALALAQAQDQRLALGFIAGACGLLLALRAAAWAITATARACPRPRQPLLRLAQANLHRPGAVTPAVVTALGLGLSLFATLAVVEANLAGQIDRVVPKKAPAFFFVDIPPDRVDAFRTQLAAIPGAGAIETVPNVRGRITHLNGVPAEQITPDPDAAWVLNGDRGLAYAADFPAGNTLVAGRWWPANYSGPPLVSMEDEIARGLGVDIGDTVSVNVLGVELTARIANLRRVDWDSLGLNFVLIFAPGALEGAPHTYLATVDAAGAAEQRVYRAVTRTWPGVSVIRMKEVLTTVSGLLGQIGAAVRATGSVTLVAGVLVLIGAMAAGQQARVRDAVMLKVLGATRRQVIAVYLIEYALLGLITGLVALALGLAGGWFLVTRVLDLEWTLSWAAPVATVAAGALLTVLLGLAGTWTAMAAPANRILRQS